MDASPSPRISKDSNERQASPRRDVIDFAQPFPGRPHRHHRRKVFVCAFDGTGNKFSGSDADSNILKIYRCLDRNAEDQFHYYQPGIGTYVTSTSLSHTGHWARFKSWYMKAKDSAVGTSFAQHVMGGYQFLMRYYSPGDDIYFFGFSRGAYTARFLAELLDHIGLLSAGNEEMVRFAWKTFQAWQLRRDRTEKEKAQKKLLLQFMCAFRETFSRPVKPLRFLGLFDTVNSVPSFETAWMQRSRFPYTARSTAKVIRHAVAIDERRGKFRSDLISGAKVHQREHYRHGRRKDQADQNDVHKDKSKGKSRGRKALNIIPRHRDTSLQPPERFRDKSEVSGVRSLSPGYSTRSVEQDARSFASVSQTSLQAIQQRGLEESSDDEQEQDIQEVWFPGCHADVGGGWPLHPGEDAALSHVPLVWMIKEAQKAGLRFDDVKLQRLNCCEAPEPVYPDKELREAAQARQRNFTVADIPHISVRAPTSGPDSPSIKLSTRPSLPHSNSSPDVTRTFTKGSLEFEKSKEVPEKSRYQHLLDFSATKGKIHDVLEFNNGVGLVGVISWKMMEYLPFRRMDLRPDGSWDAISWPLPRGEVRDMPYDAVIHNSAIKRMEADPDYRPGNLIIGGGGRGVRKAPKELGMGKWKIHSNESDAVNECYVRSELPKAKEEKAKRVPIEHLTLIR